ncbi:4-hydroxyphenylacetate 3-monooxygenase, oxygenase component [Virgibacillus salexigens]|uniref:4-hydroxyphenylacetate 3-monooxygenase n=1 Tax=Virgibacillus kapii TaxID=1638645 RepID=A0ABQ2DH52_9BACI|nr:4-hydroxyphenylacetate 3-monooxygenase, oxygenase component [Virgibacillus kapii]GGJ57924.1 putative 4-hydroxyphenylacetate 3-monooxygenase [Virgibacillus kapii]
MPAISGDDYLRRIDQLKTEVWYNGQKISGPISQHPAFRGAMKSQAELYDIQLKDNYKELMTYPSPTTGDRIGTSYLQPITKYDLFKRGKMIRTWAKKHGGMMGRSPDYMNTIVMAFAASASFLKGKTNCFPERLVKFYEEAREKDLSFTHTFINPQVNRSEYYVEDSKDPIAARIVDETDEGVIIKGARLLATQGGMTDEILVFSAGGIFEDDNAYFFSIPSNARGLKFICRESFQKGDSTFNYPLSSRFEEMDSIVVFDHVLIPWERAFSYKNIEVGNHFQRSSAFLPFNLHQVIHRQIVKLEFALGVAEEIIQSIKIAGYENVQSKMADVIVGLESMKGLLTKAEANAKTDEFGLMRPEVAPLQAASSAFPTIYPRVIEIIQLLGASGLISIPTEADFNSELRCDLNQYLQSATLDAEARVKLFRLAWDLTMSPFGTRQTQYERFFFGNPYKLASELYFGYDKQGAREFVQLFMDEI